MIDGLLYMVQFMPVLAIGFAAAYGFTPITKRLALYWNIVDQPSARKIHREPIPLLGGVAILGAFLFATLIFAFFAGTPQYLREFGAVSAGAVWLAMVGYVDDRKGMEPRVKFSAQIIAALLLMLAGIRTQLFAYPILDYALTMFWVVGITNAMNLMDNMDGLAAGIAGIAAGSFFILAASQELSLVGSLAAALCGASFGFLRYNFNPASTFMGDTGSLVIGFILAVLGIKLDFQTQTKLVSWAIPILVLGIPILDTSLVTFTRLREGRSPFQGGQDHTSHRIASLGFSHRRTVVIMYAAGITLGGLALIISRSSVAVALGVIVSTGLVGTALFIVLERIYQNSRQRVV
jgi:UDP-GlcNAc:undecaprenyl-phosphate GlcNAc-1-phosphate transferase